VVLRLHNRQEAMLALKKKGEGPVTAADIELPTTSRSSTPSM